MLFSDEAVAAAKARLESFSVSNSPGVTWPDCAIPNLDCMIQEDLDAYTYLFFLLYHYSSRKSLAIDQRRAGRIAYAKDIENACQIAYNLLPSWAKW